MNTDKLAWIAISISAMLLVACDPQTTKPPEKINRDYSVHWSNEQMCLRLPDSDWCKDNDPSIPRPWVR